MLVTGGWNGSYLASAELYDSGTNTWSTAGSLGTGRDFHTATLLPNGKVLVAAGYYFSGSDTFLASAELYDYTSGGSWSAAGSLVHGRCDHSATLLPSGKVLVAAGYTGNASTSAELYDAGTNKWSTAASLANARGFHTATLLPSGKVLAAGGYNVGYLASAELYDGGLGFLDSWRPVISSASSPLALNAKLVLGGSGFKGLSEASGGGFQSSATNYPLVLLQSLANEHSAFLLSDPAANWSNTSFTSVPVNSFPPGYAQVTVFTNGIPSLAQTINIIRFTKLQILVPGETAAPGTPSGKTGTASAQTAGTPFNVAVYAVDENWNRVYTVTDTVSITSSDTKATLPATAALVNGTQTLSLTLKTAGTATVTASDITDGTKTANTSSPISVSARPIAVTAATDTKTYDGTTSSAGVPTITSGNLVPGDSATWTQTFDNQNVGTGKTLTPTGTVNDGNGGNNYSITFVNNTSGVITARAITVTADAKTKVYGAANPAFTYTYSGLVSGDPAATFTGALATTATAGSGVGTYPITQGTLAATGNYSIGTFNGANLTVTAAPLTVSADAKSKVYGAALPALTYTYSGLVNGDPAATFTGALATSATTGSGVGTYVITKGTLAATGNYSIGAFNGANLTVTVAVLTVSADAKNKVYGAANPALTYMYTGLVNGETSATFTGALATTATASSDVGTYPITQNTLAATGNYTIGTFDGANLTVTAAPLTASADAKSKVYGEANPAFTYTYSGLVNGDTAATFTGALATAATASSDAGTYPITQDMLAATGNYAIGTFNGANLVISQASATVTLGNLTQTYDGDPKTAAASTGPAGLAVTFTYNGSTAAPTNVGSYLAVGTISDANYHGTAIGILAVNPAGTVATPAISPEAGSYIGAQSVALSCATSGATIYCTLDGSAPTTSSLKYSSAISVSATTTIKAYAVKPGMSDSAVASAMYTINLPISGGSGAPTPNVNVTAANPVDGTSVNVTGTDGGVVQLNVSGQGGALPPGCAITTVYYDAAGNVVAMAQGAQPVYKFTEPGVYVAVVTLWDEQGNPAGETEIALPISAAETGTFEGTTPPSNLAITAISLEGKLLFTPGKRDSVFFKGTIELPAGLDLSERQTLSVSLGNVVDTANLDAKGRAKAGQRNRLEKVAVKYPRLWKPATTTRAGQKATVSFTLSAFDLDTLGLECEGISKEGGIAGQSVARTVAVALVLGGTAYRVDVPVTWKLSKKGDCGRVRIVK